MLTINAYHFGNFPNEWKDMHGKPKKICMFFSRGKCGRGTECTLLHLCINCFADHSDIICPIKDESFSLHASSSLFNACNICNISFIGPSEHREHCNSQTHKDIREEKFRAIGKSQTDFSNPFATKIHSAPSMLFTRIPSKFCPLHTEFVS